MEQGTYIPHHLDDPPRFLLWSLQQTTIIGGIWVLGISGGFFFTAFFLSVGLYYMLKKFQQRCGEHAWLGWVYWHFPSCLQRLRLIPDSAIREYLG